MAWGIASLRAPRTARNCSVVIGAVSIVLVMLVLTFHLLTAGPPSLGLPPLSSSFIIILHPFPLAPPPAFGDLDHECLETDRHVHDGDLNCRGFWVAVNYCMSLIEIEQESLKLPDREKARLVRKLLDALPSADIDVSDEEVLEREQKLEAGEIEELSQEEFVRRVRKERGR